MLRVLRATAGSGKTEAAIQKIADRARRGLRSAIVVPTHQLARDKVIPALRRLGVEPQYERSVLSVVGDDGTPVCAYHEAGKALAAGGYYPRPHLCLGLGSRPMQPCDRQKTCRAFAEASGGKSLAWVGSHALLHHALEHVGIDGVLVIDDAHACLETSTISADDLNHAERLLPAFADGQQRRPLLVAVRAALEHGDGPLEPAINSSANAIEMARSAVLGGERERLAPDILSHELTRVRERGDRDRAAELGRASGTLATLARLVVEQPKPRGSVIDGKIYLTRASETLRAALTRGGPTLLIDATFDREAVEAFVGRPIDVRDIAVADGAPMRRVLLRTARLNRRHVLPHGRVQWEDGLLGALRRVVEAASNFGAHSLGLVAYKPVAEQLREALAGAAGPAAEVLREWRGEVLVGHYGSLRGLDAFMNCDAVATLCDPWPHKLVTQEHAQALSIDWRAFYQRQAAAELAQAGEGRLRAPWRTKPGLVLHAGNVIPEGWGPEAEIVQPVNGRPSKRATVDGAVLTVWRKGLHMTQKEAAKLVGVSLRTWKRVESKGPKPGTDTEGGKTEILALPGFDPFSILPNPTFEAGLPALRLQVRLDVLREAARLLAPEIEAAVKQWMTAARTVV